jgi:hypothetical protein
MNVRFRWIDSVGVLAVGVLLLAAPMAQAHHSASMFEDTKVVELRGVVKQLQWTNPHIWLQVVVEDGEGKKEWSLEGGSPNALSRSGWRRSMFNQGDSITVRFRPMKDGSPAGLFVAAKLADGTTLGRWE